MPDSLVGAMAPRCPSGGWRPARIALCLATPLLFLASGACAPKDPTGVEEEPTEAEFSTEPEPIEVYTGATFTVQGSVHHLKDNSRTPLLFEFGTLPSELDPLSSTDTPQARIFTFRGAGAFDGVLTVQSAQSFQLPDPFPVRVRTPTVELNPNAWVFADELEIRGVLLPGESVTLGVTARNNLGCTYPGGGYAIDATLTGDVGSFSVSQLSAPLSLSIPGCPDQAESGRTMTFDWDNGPPRRLGVSYDVSGGDSKGVDLAGFEYVGQYVQETGRGGIPLSGKITRESSTCGPVQPEEFDWNTVIDFNDLDGLRLIYPDATEFAGTQNPDGTLTFVSPVVAVNPTLSTREILVAQQFSYTRLPEGAISAVITGASTLEYFATAGGAPLCEEQATFAGSGVVPWPNFRYLFRP